MKLLAVILCTLGCCMAWLSWQLQPEIVGPKKAFQTVPSTKVTSHPTVRSSVDKAALIIQQNPNCRWVGRTGPCEPKD